MPASSQTTRIYLKRHILSAYLPTAVTPVLWQRTIKPAADYYFAVQDKDGASHALVFYDGVDMNGSVVAFFPSKEAADSVLAALSRVVIAGARPPSLWLWVGRFFLWALAVFGALVAGLVVYLALGGYLTPSLNVGDVAPPALPSAAAPAVQTPSLAPMDLGTPVPADDVLQPPITTP